MHVVFFIKILMLGSKHMLHRQNIILFMMRKSITTYHCHQKTTFLFRTSDSSAQYACFSDIESIINFYQNKEGIIVENTLIHNNELKN